MATLIKDLIPIIRDRLIEPHPNFWGDDELGQISALGIRDLWRDTVDLKQEHYLTIDNTNVSLAADTTSLTGIPSDVHKVYLIEPRDLSSTGSNEGLVFRPLDYNDPAFQRARTLSAITPKSATIYYAIHGKGAPVNAPTILIAPQVDSAVNLSFCYVPTLGTLNLESTVPIPGDADGAIVAWTVAFARAKEREDRAPDSSWLSVYAAEKQHLLQSLGLRQYQEPSTVSAVFEEYWG